MGVRSVVFFLLSHFSMKFLCANRIAPDGTPHSAGYSVCLCSTKRTPGLYELNGSVLRMLFRFENSVILFSLQLN